MSVPWGVSGAGGGGAGGEGQVSRWVQLPGAPSPRGGEQSGLLGGTALSPRGQPSQAQLAVCPRYFRSLKECSQGAGPVLTAPQGDKLAS